MNYSVIKFSKQWAIFCAQTKCYVLFGTKKEMTKRCKELNKEDKNNSDRLALIILKQSRY